MLQYFFKLISKKQLLFLWVFMPLIGLAINKNGDSTLTTEKYSFKNLIGEANNINGITFTTPLNPQAWSFTQAYIRKQGKELGKMKLWAKPYFDLYDGILQQNGLPKGLKYLSVIESHLQSNLVSWAGAVGPWQLMDYEAKRFGLKTGKYHDERTDYVKSTYAAAQLLKELYNEFGDWLLVIAAYNGGAGRVKQAIERSGSKDFWTLQYLLKEETRNHVKKFIATHYLMEGGGGLTTMTAAETKIYLANKSNTTPALTENELVHTDTVEVSGRFNSLIICNSLLMDIAVFNKWNPRFDKDLSEGKNYLMRLPNDKKTIFEVKKGDILLQSIRALLDGTTTVTSSK